MNLHDITPNHPRLSPGFDGIEISYCAEIEWNDPTDNRPPATYVERLDGWTHIGDFILPHEKIKTTFYCVYATYLEPPDDRSTVAVLDFTTYAAAVAFANTIAAGMPIYDNVNEAFR